MSWLECKVSDIFLPKIPFQMKCVLMQIGSGSAQLVMTNSTGSYCHHCYSVGIAPTPIGVVTPIGLRGNPCRSFSFYPFKLPSPFLKDQLSAVQILTFECDS